MTTRRRLRPTLATPARRLLPLLGALALAACGRHEAPPTAAPAKPSASSAPAAPAATPSPAGTAAPSASTGGTPDDGPFRIADVALGDALTADRRIAQPKQRFAATQPAVYARVATQGRSTGVTLGAQWRYLEGQGQPVSAITQAIATTGPAVTVFELRNPRPWPPGRYRVEITLDGQTAVGRDFEIDAAR